MQSKERIEASVTCKKRAPSPPPPTINASYFGTTNLHEFTSILEVFISIRLLQQLSRLVSYYLNAHSERKYMSA